MTLEGYAAIEYAEAHGLCLSKYNDPTEGAREGLTPDEARAVAREDSRLIYLTLQKTSMQHANQYAVVFDAAKAVAARYGVLPWYGASDQDLISAAASRGCPASELKEWADARKGLA